MEIVSSLLSVPSILVNEKDRYGSTSLHIAVSEKRGIEIIQALLKSPSINVNVKDNFSKTPLHVAVSIDYVGAVMALLAMPGILVNESDKSGKTILQYARENGHKKCIELLQKSLKK